MDSTYRFEFEGRYKPFLRLQNITPDNSWVTVSDTHVRAVFGFARTSIALDNIQGVCLSGPYRGYRAIGTRLSLSDSGLTFGSTTVGGVCIEVKEPVRGVGPRKHRGVTLTVADRGGFAADVRHRAGLDEAP